MLPLLLLQGMLGLQGYTHYVAEAAAQPPAMMAPPIVVVPLTLRQGELISWVPMEPGSLPIIFAMNDFLATAPAPVLRYIAFHEVCHIRLGHYLLGAADPNLHLQVNYCLDQQLGSLTRLNLEFSYLMWQKTTLIPLRRRVLGLRGP